MGSHLNCWSFAAYTGH